MTDESKFTELHPDPSGRDIIPPTRNLTGLMSVFGSLQEAGRKASPEPPRAVKLPEVVLRPYAPSSIETPDTSQ